MTPNLPDMAVNPAAYRDALILPTGRGPARFGDVMADPLPLE